MQFNDIPFVLYHRQRAQYQKNVFLNILGGTICEWRSYLHRHVLSPQVQGYKLLPGGEGEGLVLRTLNLSNRVPCSKAGE